MVLGLLNVIKTFKNCIDAHVSHSISLFIIDASSDRTSSLTADRFKEYLDEQVKASPNQQGIDEVQSHQMDSQRTTICTEILDRTRTLPC